MAFCTDGSIEQGSKCFFAFSGEEEESFVTNFIVAVGISFGFSFFFGVGVSVFFFVGVSDTFLFGVSSFFRGFSFLKISGFFLSRAKLIFF